MPDIFTRIGAALEHLLNDSTLNGVKREEVQALADELKADEAQDQAFQGSVPGLIQSEVAAQLAAAGYATQAYVDQALSSLADTLEAADIQFQSPTTGGADTTAGDAGSSTNAGPGGADTTAADTTTAADDTLDPSQGSETGGADAITEPAAGSDSSGGDSTAGNMSMVGGGASDVIG